MCCSEKVVGLTHFFIVIMAQCGKKQLYLM